MKLLVGLGNPGQQYEKTRHNVGFMVLEQFFKDFEPERETVWEDNKKFKADIAEITWQSRSASSGQAPHGSEKVILVKPKTYMNNSGMAVQLVASYYKVEPKDIWIVHDDVDLPLGTLRIRLGGGSAGHRGIESLLSVYPDGKFWRFRCGIGRPEESASVKGVDGFVLGEFNHEEHGRLRELLRHTSLALQMALEEGLDAAGNKYNTK